MKKLSLPILYFTFPDPSGVGCTKVWGKVALLFIKNVPKKGELEIAKQQVTKMGTPINNTDKNWKEKAIERGKQLNRTKQELKRQKTRAVKWRSRYYAKQQSQKLGKVNRHKYGLELMWMAVLMHINYNVSLRGVSQSIAKLGELYGLSINYISHMSIRNWCLKFGLYCLSSPIAKGRYVLICDESVEIGRERLLLLLVVPIDHYSAINPLSMQDVKVLDLGIQQSWSSTQVAKKIKGKSEAYELEFIYGISDQCSKLRGAMGECGISWIGDCTHEIANVSKKLFQKDVASNSFITKMNLLRCKWILSKHMLYVPPELRTKNRFHQMFIIHKWAEEILQHWDQICESAQKELLFVVENKSLIKAMRQCYDLIDLFSTIFKAKGIQTNSLKQWHQEVKAYQIKESLSPQGQQFIEKMNDYLLRQKAVIPQDTQILCCSDIIESAFGKYKNKKVKIITDDVLKIAAYSKEGTFDDIKEAMQKVKIEDALKWKVENTIVSKLALLKQRKLKKKIAA